MYARKILVYVIILTGSLISELLGGSSTKNIVASPTNSTLNIDGILNESDWNLAIPVTDFLQYDPREGESATEKTSVRILYDDHALYIGVHCFDSDPKGIREQLTRRDRSSEADRFSVTIDSYNDGQTGFVFVGTVSGVQSDGVLYHDGTLYDIQWDAVWNYAVKIVEGGWSAEFEIPFSALRFAKQEGEYTWGINFRRYIARKKEIVEWVMIPRRETGAISKIGNISGIIGVNPSIHLSIMPYVVSSANFNQQFRPFTIKNVPSGNLGADIKYGVTNNFTLDAAINPDFGQVEVDQEVMNLTVFETYFPEKRPFFLEGGHIFSFGVAADEKRLNLFYSRRIGRGPRYSYIDDAKKIIKQPQTTTILGAGKLSGRTDNGLTIGALTIITEREKAIYDDTLGNRRSAIIEPRASYNVFRIKQEVLKNSSIGWMATGAFLDKNTPSITNGFDWNIRFLDNTYAIDGYYTNSQFSFGSSKYFGTGGKLFIGKISGENWLFNSSYQFATKDFYINELGLYNQPREQSLSSVIIYKIDKPSWIFFRYLFMLNGDYHWNFDNNSTVKNLTFSSLFILKNFWKFTSQFLHAFPAYDGAERGIIGLYKRPTISQVNATIISDTRFPISFTSKLIYETDSKSKDEIIGMVNITLRPTTWFELVPMFTFSKRWKEETGVLFSGKYLTDKIDSKEFTVFGDRDLELFDMALKGIFTITTKLSVQFFSQVLFYKWHYQNFKKLISPEHFIFYEYDFRFRDFNYKIFNANMVLRWEFLPGSTFYFVWTQQRSDFDLFYHSSFSENFSNIFRTPANNVLLFKINYWLSL